jgi:hypothetical protein
MLDFPLEFTSRCIAEATLELLDSHGGLAGRLVIKLHECGHERDPVQVGRVAISDARRELAERGIGTANPMRDSVDDAVALAASASAAASPLANALKHVVEKTKAIVDFLDEAAKVNILVDP